MFMPAIGLLLQIYYLVKFVNVRAVFEILLYRELGQTKLECLSLQDFFNLLYKFAQAG